MSYVSDIALTDNPFVIGMDKLVNRDQADDFIGKDALTRIKAEGVKRPGSNQRSKFRRWTESQLRSGLP